MSHDTRALYMAVSNELSDIASGVQTAGDLMGEVLSHLPPQQRLSYMARVQAFDVLVQRLEALSGLSSALGNDQALDTALAALPLAEMAERLQEAAHRGNPSGSAALSASPDAGELHLFE
ncbi:MULTISPECIES: hypothetical protein [unclassified Brevundimonas]|uniref:hypothetical protein n=1 Tax=unclassified Brevundimonas TaxID=2622653 RepID=UPI0025B7CAF4|nr:MULTISPECIES: hypothetical protein [unclassified Brevundimonas]